LRARRIERNGSGPISNGQQHLQRKQHRQHQSEPGQHHHRPLQRNVHSERQFGRRRRRQRRMLPSHQCRWLRRSGRGFGWLRRRGQRQRRKRLISIGCQPIFQQRFFENLEHHCQAMRQFRVFCARPFILLFLWDCRSLIRAVVASFGVYFYARQRRKKFSQLD